MKARPVGVDIFTRGRTDGRGEANSRVWQIFGMCLSKKKSQIHEPNIFSEERVRNIIISIVA